MKRKNVIRLSTFLAAPFALSIFIVSCASQKSNENKMKKDFTDFITKLEAKVIPLYKEVCTANWNASITGADKDFEKAAKVEFEFSTIFTNKEDYKKLKAIKESNQIKDEILSRELLQLYNNYLGNQIDSAKLKVMIDMQSAIEQKFNTFRAEVKGKNLTDNELEEVLQTSMNSEELKEAWLATKKSGKVVSDDIIKLVKKRNEVAKELGFNNFHEMSLKLSEQDPKEIESLFDELDNLTREAFVKEKDEVDAYFAKYYKIKKEDLKPWHYQNRFFQEAPKIYKVDLDTYFKDKDIVKLTERYYASIGMPIDDMVKKSDLYEKKGKNQHAYCTNIDKNGDIRVLCNVKPNMYWMNTLLHEYGHASYDKYIDKSLPFFLREPAHTFTTEAIAELFGRMASNGQWIKDNIGISENEKQKIEDISFKSLRLQQLVFSRWAQVMYRFEKGLYENPDQDLNKLWWDIVEKYQLLKRPEGRNEPDWASKIHIATSPCYYHNYLLGELLASQMHYYICDNILKTKDYKNASYTGNKEVGKFFIEKIFKPGNRMYWDDMIKAATGEKLTAKYYAKQFVE